MKFQNWRRVLAAASFLWLLPIASVQAQNLIVNGGFENNPPTAFGNNIGYSIAPWTLSAGNQSNVVTVDGGVNYNYGTGGPALDADPATGPGVRQHYLDIASGANDFYQSFTVPTCGAAPAPRTVTYSGWFSTRDNLSGNGSISIRLGAGTTGTLLGTSAAVLPAPLPPLNSGTAPWVFVTGTATVTSGTTISYVVSMDNNLNFDDAVMTFNSVTCVTSQLTMEKAWVGAVVNDTATVTVSRLGVAIDTLASTANAANEVDADATPVLAFQGESLVLAETLGAGNGGAYDSALSCSGGGSTLSGSTLTIGTTGTPTVCRYTNTRRPADLSITKTNTPGVNGNQDQANDTVLKGANTSYTIIVRNAGPGPASGAVVRDPAPSGMTCISATCGNPTGGAVCPAVTVAGLQSAGGINIATMPVNSSLEFVVTCTVQ